MNLTDLRARVRVLLMDVDGLVWPDDLLDESIRAALDAYTLTRPLSRYALLVLEEGSLDNIDLSGLTDLAGVLRVTVSRTAGSPGNDYTGWQLAWNGDTPLLILQSIYPPKAGDILNLLYATSHRIEGLDLATVTTIDPRHSSILVQGAAAYACRSRAIDRSDGFKNDPHAAEAMLALGDSGLRVFRQELEQIRMRSGTGLDWLGGWNIV